jgi:hypothetical protein
MGGVQNMEVLDRERPAEDLRAEARPAHPKQDDALVLASIEPLKLVEPLEHPVRLVEPAEPAGLVRAGPDRRIASPDAIDELRDV